MKTPALLPAALMALLLSTLACTCGSDAPPSAAAPAQGRTLEPLPDVPAVQVDREALPGAEGTLAVVATRPRGPVEGSVRPTITFSRPIVALQSVQSEQELPPPATIEPAVAGSWRWLGSSAVEFVPAGQLPYATAFRVTVPAGLQALDGSRLEAPHQFEFSTPAPQVQRIDPPEGHRWLGREPRFTLILNQPVAHLDEHASLHVVKTRAPLQLRVVEQARVAEEVQRQERRRHPRMEADPFENQQTRYVLQAAGPVPLDSDLQLVIDGGLRGEQGTLTLGETQRHTYRTYGPAAVVGAERCLWPEGQCPWGPVVLYTSNPVDVESLRKHLRIEPAVEIDWEQVESRTPPRWNPDIEHPYAMLPGDWRPGTTYRVHVAAGMVDVFGQHAPAWEGSVHLDDRAPTFDTGSDVALLESVGDGALPIESVNVPALQVELWRLDAPALARALAQREAPGDAATARFTLDTAAEENRSRWTPLQVRERLGGVRSAFFATRVQAPSIAESHPRLVFGQMTDLAVHAKLGATSGVAWVTRLSTGSVVPGAQLSLYDREGRRKWQGRTDADGIASVPGLSELVPQEDRGHYRWEAPFALVVAEKAGDAGATLSTWMDGLAPSAFGLEMEWDGRHGRALGQIFSERGIYRPGDTVHTKGVLRIRRLGEVQRPRVGAPITLKLRDPQGEAVEEREVRISRFGTIHADFSVGADAQLGTWMLEASLAGEGEETLHWTGSFRVEEYRAPQFRVDLRLPQEEAVAGDRLQAHLLARYLFGGAMAEAGVRWSVHRSTLDFSPPGNEGFVFGTRTWWWDDGAPAPSGAVAAGGTGSTDETGALTLALGEAEAPAGRTWRYTVEAEVADVNRQRVAARASLPVHPAALYAGARVATSGFAEVGREVPLELVAVEPSGKRVEGAPLELVIKRRSWQSIRKKGAGGQWFTESEPVEQEAARCSVRSDRTAQRCSFTPQEPGLYLIVASVTDQAGRRQTTRDSFYVTGGGWVSWQRNDTDRIDLVADRSLYEPGDTAQILVKSPYPEAEALLTVERAGVRSARRVKLQGSATTLQVPIGEADVPNVYVGVLLARGRVDEGGIESGEDPGRPAVRVGYTELKVEKSSRRLSVQVRPDAGEKRPREKVRVGLQVRGHDGAGAPAELAVWAVDESVLRLTDYRAPDLVDEIHRRQGLSVRIGEPLIHLVQRRLYGEKGRSAGGGGGDGTGAGIRSHFRTTILFEPSVLTDTNGRAEVEFALPDNLTTWRVLAVAVGEDERFGAGEAEVQVSKPLLALPALPRLARVGDAFEAGVVLHGHRFSSPEVQVTAAAEGLRLDGPARRQVAVVEGKPQEVRFRFVAERQGTAVLRFRVQGGGESDGVEQRIPVRLPVAMEAVATYGQTGDRAVEGLQLPAGARQDVGGLEVSLASTALAGFDENFEQLVDYPYGCLEQISSRLVPFVALRELSGRFDIPWQQAAAAWIDEGALQRWGSSDPDVVVRRTITSIEGMQNHDGGYRYWPTSPCSSQLASAYSVWALHRAREVGYQVDEEALARGRDYLANVVAAGRCEACGWGCNPPDDSTRVFALWTLARSGEARPSYYGALYRERESLPLFAQAMLADAIFVGQGDRAQARQLLTEVLNHGRESAGGLHFQEVHDRSYAALWSSDVRTTAIVLTTLANVMPDHPYVPKIARWLGGARGEDGRFGTTQEAAFALTGLVEVTRAKEQAVPDYVARVALGDRELVSRRFEGRSLEIAQRQVPMERLGQGELGFEVDGEGVLYYGARLRYAPGEMPTEPLDRGLTVQRWFEPWEGGGQARRFRAGELVRVRVRVASSQERHFAVIEAPLPAGLEAVDTTLASTAALPGRQGEEPAEGYEYESADDLYGDRDPEAFNPWAERFYSPFNHSELRDDRVVFFADRLPPGVHVASFVARATTPGRFVLPPARAEEMYAPETFGRSDGGRLEVLAAEPMAGR